MCKRIRFAGGLIAVLGAVLLSACGGGGGSSGAPDFVLDRTFDDPTPTGDDAFGYSVALDGNRALIGARDDATHGSRVGQAHLFDTTTGDLLQTFDDPTPTGDDAFGWSVALDGNHALIGAPNDATQGFPVGQVHLFDATTGDLLQTFDDPNPILDNAFGRSVAIDGNHVLVGAPGPPGTLDARVGQASLFDATTGDLIHIFDDPTRTGRDAFGSSVALYGTHVLIGAPGDRTRGNPNDTVGQAYLFDTITGGLLRIFDDPAPSGQAPGERGDSFGYSVALDGNLALIGAPGAALTGNAILFDVTTGDLLRTFDNPTPDWWHEFGHSVALDGNLVLIGESEISPQRGQAHLFDADTGNLLQTFDPPTPAMDNLLFGRSVAIDGNRILIGATRASTTGDAYLFTAPVMSVIRGASA